MEALALVIGGVGIVAAILAVGILLGAGLSMWETWWLYPLWPVAMMPLGLPAITFWQLLAVNVFVSVFWMSVSPTDYAKEEDKTTRNLNSSAVILVKFLRPVVAFYFIRWAVG